MSDTPRACCMQTLRSSVCVTGEGMQAAIRARKLLALVNSLELCVFLAAEEKVSIWPVEVACHYQRTRHLP